ncbi:MAG: hypothetical protein EP335_17085 [Alphaproteobacteria bacterium]|nr:MAG: hypothetical protein EP335_17085 [Alphaproteobacteria bacterium]
MLNASILVECGRKSGLGRVRRTLTLANALKARGVACDIFVTSDEGMDLVSALGFTAKLADQLPARHDLLVVDTCSDSARALSALCATARISCVIDDLAERPVVCDYVINPNLYASELDYSAYRVREVLRGPAHALIHDDFFARALPADERAGVVVSFGGTDDGRLAAPIAALIAKESGEPVYVPVPAYLEPAAELTALAGQGVEVLRAPDMAGLLGRARLYVGAAGATVLEALAAGCPVCAIATQSDQHKNVAYLGRIDIAALPVYDARKAADLALAALASHKSPMVLSPRAVSDIAGVIHRAAAAA